MKIVVAGTGYVGLVTGVALANIGHQVTCIDVNKEKIDMLNNGICPIYEDNLEEYMKKNKDRLTYTIDYKSAYNDADVIFIGVGTPERENGSANLDYVYTVCDQIVESITKNCIVVIKSTVPIGTNDEIEKYINEKSNYKINIVSNPEFLAQGTALRDTLFASRIVVGVENEETGIIMKKLYEPLTNEPYNVPILLMNRKSAEMVKYASNDFLALKISYINEIANFCEKTGANIDDVTNGMKYDKRIGDKFLNAGIGYGGSCFPKDTKALHYISKINGEEIKTIKATIEINKKQKLKLFNKILNRYSDINNMNISVLGCSFKPKTDDLRDGPSIDNVKELLKNGANVSVYDPLDIALNNFKKIFGNKIKYYTEINECIKNADIVIIMTEHSEIVNYDIDNYLKLMKTPIIYDGRNCYNINKIKSKKINYISIGRQEINNL